METTRLTSLHIEGFKRFELAKLDIRPLNVFIGVNGSGKSSVLEIIRLISAFAQAKTVEYFDGSFSSSITKTLRDPKLKIAYGFTFSKGEKISHHLTLGLGRSGQHSIVDELLFSHTENKDLIKTQNQVAYFFDALNQKIIESTWSFNFLEPAIGQPHPSFGFLQQLKEELGSIVHYAFLPTYLKSEVRRPQKLSPALLPGADGSNLISCLYNMRETDEATFSLLEDTLRAVFPDFEKLKLPITGVGYHTLHWKDKNFDTPFVIEDLSDGTIRFIWLAALLLNRNLPTFVLIDEPEIGLHPKMLAMVADMLRDAALRSNVFVATHSDRLLNYLEPEDVVVVTTEDGKASLQRGNSLDLEHWLKDYTLGELWNMNVIGERE